MKESPTAEDRVRIGELSKRTGVPTRLLRYYEEQELLVSDRSPNGYRDYAESSIERVAQIRGLLDAGLPTRVIKQILPCLDGPSTIHVREATPELIASLEHEREQMDSRIRCLTRNRNAVVAYLDAVRGSAAQAPDTAGSTPEGR